MLYVCAYLIVCVCVCVFCMLRVRVYSIVSGVDWIVCVRCCVCFPRAMGLVVSRETQHMGVPYYVDKSFEKEYRGESLEELEKTIENDYIDHLQTSCWKEKQQSTSGAVWALFMHRSEAHALTSHANLMHCLGTSHASSLSALAYSSIYWSCKIVH